MPARRGRRQATRAEEPPTNPHAAMSWAQRLKRVFKIEIETCEICGGQMEVIAAIEDPAVIKRILAHLENSQDAGPHPEHPPRRNSHCPAPKGVGRRHPNSQVRRA